jgi:formylglycine-generating enzyme required for sulfatase activity
LASVLMLAGSVSRADVFNMPSGETSLSFVTVGDPDNSPDTGGWAGTGSVPYAYRMGKYDLTVGQYCQFLNAVAKTDTYGLYNSYMTSGTHLNTIAITQTGSSGSYTYSYSGSYSEGVDCPMFCVTWGDAARFCNWLQNGQPAFSAGTPGEVAGSTETGAYTLSGDTTSYMETRNPGAIYFIPSLDEWYKAAYYKGGNTSAGYWAFPTQSNTAPGDSLPDVGNSANYKLATDPINLLTPVGAFSASPGPYGTFDMGGDVWQWNEEDSGGDRNIRGGGFASTSLQLASTGGFNGGPGTDLEEDVGFRVASIAVPEPSIITLFLASAACLLGYVWRRRTA